MKNSGFLIKEECTKKKRKGSMYCEVMTRKSLCYTIRRVQIREKRNRKGFGLRESARQGKGKAIEERESGRK
jgi:hypothetical protein